MKLNKTETAAFAAIGKAITEAKDCAANKKASLPLPQPPPLRGFRSAAGHESLTKGHEILFAPKDRGTACVCWRKANGPFPASSSFVTFCAIFVSRDFGITRRVGTWRRRRVKRSFEPGDGSALPIAEGDLPRSRVFVFRAKRREASQPPRPPPAQSPHRKNPCGGETPHERSARKPQPQEREV